MEDVPATRWNDKNQTVSGWKGAKLSRADAPDIFVAHGPKTGPTLLLFPGVCDPWFGFEPIFEHLTPHFSLVIPDLRGHGLSGRDAAGAYRVVNHVEDALFLASEAIEGDFYVGGNSLGALIAAGVAAALPNRVKGALLEDGPFFMTEPTEWETRPLRTRVFADIAERLKQKETDGLSAEAFANLYAERLFAFMPDGDFPQRIRWANKLMGHLAPIREGLLDDAGIETQDKAILSLISGGDATWGELFPPMLIAEFAGKYQHVDWRVPAGPASIEFSAGFDHAATLAAIKCPTIVVEADRDLSGLLVPDGLEKVMAPLGDRGRHVLIENSMHEIHQTHPAELADEFLSLLESES